MSERALSVDHVAVDLACELQSVKETRPALYDLVVRTFNANQSHFRLLALHIIHRNNDDQKEWNFSERSVAYPYRLLAECTMLNLTLAHLLNMCLESPVPEESSLISVLLAISHPFKPLVINEERLLVNQRSQTQGSDFTLVPFGSEVSISLDVTGSPRPMIQWLKGDKKSGNDKNDEKKENKSAFKSDDDIVWRRIEGVQGSELRLDNFDQSDQGLYMCSISHSVPVKETEEEDSPIIPSKVSSIFTLSLEKGSILVTKLPPSLLMVDENSEICLEVDAKSELQLSFQWNLNKENIEHIFDPSEFELINRGRTLKLNHFKDIHVGRYSCRIQNTFKTIITEDIELGLTGTAESEEENEENENVEGGDCSDIIITHQPRLSGKTRRLSSGDTVRLRCTALCSNDLKYEWVKQAFTVDVVNSPSICTAITPLIPFSRGNLMEDELTDRIEDKSISFWLYYCLVTCPMTARSRCSREVKVNLARHNTRRLARPVSKLALVICQDKFDNEAFHSLSAPRVDGVSLTRALLELDFQVLALSNLSAQEMRNALKLFCSFLESDCYALFYFNGHAISTDECLLLLATDSVLTLPQSFVAQSEVEAALDLCQPMLAVVVYDSCRDKAPQELRDALRERAAKVSFSSTSSLKSSFFIAYGTRANMPSFEFASKSFKEGLYVKHLLKHIKKDISVAAMFEQLTESFAQEEDHSLSGRMTPETKNCLKQIFYLTSPLRSSKMSCSQQRFFAMTRYEALHRNDNNKPSDKLSFHLGLIKDCVSRETELSLLKAVSTESECIKALLRLDLEPLYFSNEARLRLSLVSMKGEVPKRLSVQVVGVNVRIESREDKYRLEELFVTYVPPTKDEESKEEIKCCGKQQGFSKQMGPIFKLPEDELRECRLTELQKLSEPIVLRLMVMEDNNDFCSSGLVQLEPPIIANFPGLKSLV